MICKVNDVIQGQNDNVELLNNAPCDKSEDIFGKSGKNYFRINYFFTLNLCLIISKNFSIQ